MSANDNSPYPYPKITHSQFSECIRAIDKIVIDIPIEFREIGLFYYDPEVQRFFCKTINPRDFYKTGDD